MRKICSISLIIPLLFCASCDNGEDAKKSTVFHFNEKNQITVINFADTHVDQIDDLNDENFLTKVIKKSIDEAKPDLITFSGDNAWGSSTLDCYKKLCDFMDEFQIPYFFQFGNHDTEAASKEDIMSVINNSNFGYIECGPNDIHGRSNYVIDIKDDNEKTVHSIYMMDSGDYYLNDVSNLKYVRNPVSGCYYGSYFGKQIYGDITYDNIKGNQVDWYKTEVNKRNNESTLITHIPFMEYINAYENYQNAILSENQTLIDSMQPVGNCKMLEACCCSSTNFGFFDIIKECGSTKNVIVGHDHINDYSLLYEGVRLTYGLKTGDQCYWESDGSVCGYTKLTIDKTGKASLSQKYINPYCL